MRRISKLGGDKFKRGNAAKRRNRTYVPLRVGKTARFVPLCAEFLLRRCRPRSPKRRRDFEKDENRARISGRRQVYTSARAYVYVCHFCTAIYYPRRESITRYRFAGRMAFTIRESPGGGRGRGGGRIVPPPVRGRRISRHGRRYLHPAARETPFGIDVKICSLKISLGNAPEERRRCSRRRRRIDSASPFIEGRTGARALARFRYNLKNVSSSARAG